jgi:hypothetical protein
MLVRIPVGAQPTIVIVVIQEKPVRFPLGTPVIRIVISSVIVALPQFLSQQSLTMLDRWFHPLAAYS